jgi:hypothetical protein
MTRDDQYSGTKFGRNFKKRKEHIIKTKLKRSSEQAVSRKILRHMYRRMNVFKKSLFRNRSE